MLDFHAHIYFDSQTRESALSLRDALLALPSATVTLGQVNEGPRGPHTVPSYEIYIRAQDFYQVVAWLVFHHGTHSVLIHPLTENEVEDHTHRALWLGKKQELNLAALIS